MHLSLSKDAIYFLKNKSQKKLTTFLNPKIKSDFNHSFTVNWHKTIISFNFQDYNFYLSCKNYFPPHWIIENHLNPQHDIFLYKPENFNLDSSFWDDTNSDCHFFKETNESEICLQRDFVAKKSNEQIHAVCLNQVSDGFFNLMRWALPKHWIQNNQFLIHSSCVLGPNNKSYLCLGPSGAGKTTISSFVAEDSILGDDMNLLTLKDNKAYVTPSLLGQRFENNKLYGKSFELDSIFWLKQSAINKVSLENDHSTSFYLSQSLVNIFWKNLSPVDINKIQKFISYINSNYKVKNLEFNLNGEIWNYVFRK